MWHQIPHYRHSIKGKRFIAGLGKKKFKSAIPKKQSMFERTYEYPVEDFELGGNKVDKVSNKIVSMLKEDTGIAMMDSGGASGRNWQMNQSKNLEGAPAFTIDLKGDDFIVMLSTYHFLNERLQITPASEALQKKFKAFAKKSGDNNLSDMEEFAEQLEGATGLYGEGKPSTTNTYNYESLLDQVLQYVYFELGGKAYVILQIHGGADVRGGYTTPYIFEVDSDNWLAQDTNAYINFSDGTNIMTDDASHWYDEDTKEVEITQVEGQAEHNPKKIKVNGAEKEVRY